MAWWIGSARSGREFEVRDAILALGAYAWVAREFATVRPPTKRRHVAVPRPLGTIGRYVFIQVSDEGWHQIRDVKHLAGRMLPVSEASAARSLLPFMDRVETDFALRKARFDAGEKLNAYAPGDALRILEGPLAQQLARFKLVEEGDSELTDKVVADVDFLGGTRRVRLDPLHVQKVAAE